MHERTVVLLKPDALQRGICGEIISRIERKGLKLVGLKMVTLSDETVQAHYAHHADKPFFADVKEFMQSSPVVAICWEGLEAVETVRTLTGPTNARRAPAGTIRGDFAMSLQFNLIHASDSPEAAGKELALFFSPEELHSYEKNEYSHLYAADER
jgi:nucleoside-diphosphate kinase